MSKVGKRPGIPMTQALEILCEELRLCDQFSNSSKGKKNRAADFKMREVVAWHIFVYDRIRQIDEEWSGEMQDAGERPPIEDARALQEIYAGWAKRAKESLVRA